MIKDCDADIEQVAKVYSPDKNRTDEENRRFFQFFKSEIKLLHSLYHKNIVRIFSAHLYEQSFSGILIMEYIQGMTLDKYFEGYNQYWGNLDSVFVQVVDAFVYLEKKGVVHRDVRATNIMVDYDNVVKIIDFGFGKASRQGETSNSNSVLSVINHSEVSISPEEERSGVYDSLTDMFYLGELLNRLILKNSETVKSFRYMPIVQKMMSFSRADRYKSFAELRKVVDDWQPWNDVSEIDKEIYVEFADAVTNIIVERSSDSVITLQEETFLTKLDSVIANNALECYLPNASLLSSIMITGAYRYRPSVKVDMEILKSFRRWFASLPNKKKELVLSSLRSRLDNVKIATPSEEPPF
ncbi:MAG: protein kinase family protein [Kiritimatiellae bacterium]|nr:protein kinase family protein [Kiritimatiellia bacterium]